MSKKDEVSFSAAFGNLTPRCGVSSPQRPACKRYRSIGSCHESKNYRAPKRDALSFSETLRAKAPLASLACLLVVAAFAVVLLGGCAADSVSSGAEATDATPDAQSESTFDVSALDLSYADRDLDASYDEATAVRIDLLGDSAEVGGASVSIDGSTVTITAAGTYLVSGSLDDGQLAVDASSDDKVQIVLAEANIHNEDGPALYVKQADKVFVTLAAGTDNVLSDGADYVLEDGSDEPYATLFSKDDLTLNGEGSLTVEASYRHAICSKDDLVVTGGTYTLSAVEDAVRGRDCVKICDGSFQIEAGGDGIKSNNGEDAERGFVSIDGGSFSIDAGDDGIQAVTYLRIAGGDLDISAVDDALHSDTAGVVEDGTLSVVAGDDAFHAETVLTVDGGVIDVADCYEGLEAEKLYINGGETHITARDDALNAASAETTTGDDGAAGDAGAGAAGREGGAGAFGTDAPFDAEGEAFDNAGAPDGAFAEGGAGMGDENCLIQISGGYTVLDASGDGMDSNGSVEVTGGVLLVSGPESGADGALDYDLSATVSGGTVVVVGSSGMAQNFTDGSQPFAFVSANAAQNDAGVAQLGEGAQDPSTGAGASGAAQSVAVVDGDGQVVASFYSPKGFGVALVSSPAFVEGGAYSLVLGGEVEGANADGYADSGMVSGGTAVEFTASTTAEGGMGGLSMDGGGMPAGRPGDIRIERRDGAPM